MAYRIVCRRGPWYPWYFTSDQTWASDASLAHRFVTQAEAHNMGNTLPFSNWVVEPILDLADADPWLGDTVRLLDNREGLVRGLGHRNGQRTVHVQFPDGSWAEVPEADVLVVRAFLDLSLRYGRNGCWR